MYGLWINTRSAWVYDKYEIDMGVRTMDKYEIGMGV